MSNGLDIIVALVASSVLGIGAIWDLSLSLFWGVPSWCSFLRRWNTSSNDLLAMVMFWSCVYLFVAPYVADKQMFFLGCYLSALFCHLFLLQILHGWGIEMKKP